MTISVLDKGKIELLDPYPNEMHAVRPFRKFYKKGVDTNNAEVNESNAQLIKGMVERNEMSPFEHIIIRLYIYAPIFVLRQWMRHRIGSYSEISMRYKDVKDFEFYAPNWATKKGEEIADSVNDYYESYIEKSMELYVHSRDCGVPKEQARFFIPNTVYTHVYATYNLRSLINFMMQRSDKHAQFEIREYSDAIVQMMTKHCPATMSALNGMGALESIEPKEEFNPDNVIVDDELLESVYKCLRSNTYMSDLSILHKVMEFDMPVCRNAKIADIDRALFTLINDDKVKERNGQFAKG